jgi:hypothetical protein
VLGNKRKKVALRLPVDYEQVVPECSAPDLPKLLQQHTRPGAIQEFFDSFRCCRRLGVTCVVLEQELRKLAVHLSNVGHRWKNILGNVLALCRAIAAVMTPYLK